MTKIEQNEAQQTEVGYETKIIDGKEYIHLNNSFYCDEDSAANDIDPLTLDIWFRLEGESKTVEKWLTGNRSLLLETLAGIITEAMESLK